MKRNIDLTLNGDFQKKFNKKSLIKIFRKYPWSKDKFKHNENYNVGFICGNKQDRKNMINYKSWEETCQRCGIKLLPWQNHYGLCSKCNNLMQEEGYGNTIRKKDDIWLIKMINRRIHK